MKKQLENCLFRVCSDEFSCQKHTALRDKLLPLLMNGQVVI